MGNLQCNVYFTTSCKYKEESSTVPALQKATVYGERQKCEPAILIWYEERSDIDVPKV